MYRLKAAEELPLFQTTSLSMDIHRLTNPINSYTPSASRMETHPRMKKTVPKQPKESKLNEQESLMFCDSDVESSPIFHTPPHTPPAEKRMKVVKRQRIETQILRSLEDDGFEFDNESFRRFGSRKRKQTEFLGVGSEEMEGPSNRRMRSRSRKLLFLPPSIREPRNQPSSPSDGMHSLVMAGAPVEQKADETELTLDDIKTQDHQEQAVSFRCWLISLHLTHKCGYNNQ